MDATNSKADPPKDKKKDKKKEEDLVLVTLFRVSKTSN